MFGVIRTVLSAVVILSISAACTKDKKTPKTVAPAPPAKAEGNDSAEALKKLQDQIAEQNARIAILEKPNEELAKMRTEIETLKGQRDQLLQQIEKLKGDLAREGADTEALKKQIADLKAKDAELLKKIATLESLKADVEKLIKDSQNLQVTLEELKKRLVELEKKLEEKKSSQSVSVKNRQRLLKSLLQGHTDVYSLHGKYKVMVIPVQFSDYKFADAEYLKNGMQKALFDPNNKNSMRSYYRHASLGKFDVDGIVTEPIEVGGKLADYGKAMPGGTNDQNARGLVTQSLLKLMINHRDPKWWDQFDRWDLNDYDGDMHYNEADGFIDAVVLIYAGKSQASCQRAFDPEGKKPGSDEVPAGPRHDSAVECFNRIWPHRSAISLAANDPQRTSKGPMIEGIERPSFNGLKINDHLFALDYNMQSEFSDLSTFMHEYGHSITLPDVYAQKGENSVGSWELMASNAENQAQELSSYSKLSLGWIKPKVIKQGERTSAYLGAYNFVTHTQRNQSETKKYDGPNETLEKSVDEEDQSVSILSRTPSTDEPVYRSVVVTTNPSYEKVKVAEFPQHVGSIAAYTSRFDGNEKSWNKKIVVPKTGDATLTFDTIYHIETETNFDSNEEPIKVVTDFDVGEIRVNKDLIQTFRLISGDHHYDTLTESNPAFEAALVLELRKKKATGPLPDAEKKEFDQKKALCQKPIWVKKSVDLAKYRGQEIEFKIAYRTDGGYTEFGMVIDNIKYGETLINFESFEEGAGIGEFVALRNGEYNQQFSQFYLMEYRTPGLQYTANGQELSHNMDNNIDMGTQSLFVEKGMQTPLSQFRAMKFDYQPGVLVWYFNSKFDRVSNNPSAQKGKGYLLVLNSKVQELVIPADLSNPELFEDDHYKDPAKDAAFGAYLKNQNRIFACFAYIEYYKYLNGVAPDCSGIESDWHNYMTKLNHNGRKLIFRHEGFNNVLPKDRYANFSVGQPFRNGPYLRTGLSAFRPATSDPATPFKVYKEQNGKLVIDAELTSAQKKYDPTDSFSDASQELPKHAPFIEDTVQVEKVGFNFKVVEPSALNMEGYSTTVSPDDHAHVFRRPMVKVLIDWK